MRSPRLASLRGLIVLLVCLALLAIAALGGFGVYYSNQLLNVSHKADPYGLRILAVTAKSVTLPRNADTERPGTYGLAWRNGSAVVGAITARTATAVARQVQGSRPPVGTAARLVTGVWLGDPQATRGLAYRDVTYASPVGRMPAWYVPGSKRTWVVAVHGRGSNRQEPLRILPTLHRLGLPVLDISYRNDLGAPPETDRIYHLGDREWRDVEAAVTYAVSKGAQRIVLYGWSMGGALIDAFLQRSAVAPKVTAVVLDAPVLDWRATLALQGKNRGLPLLLTATAEQIVRWRIGIRWSDFDLDDHPTQLTRPTLIFHGEADASVPFGPARRLAEAAPKVVFVPVPFAGHTQSWNVNPAKYESQVTAFLRPYAR